MASFIFQLTLFLYDLSYVETHGSASPSRERANIFWFLILSIDRPFFARRRCRLIVWLLETYDLAYAEITGVITFSAFVYIQY